ncbi:MAG: beta-lactamase family protein [Crocinitomicaceae bacterium]|nr:beta-lactamase family protein [Crocinitomicaceae bacterium]
MLNQLLRNTALVVIFHFTFIAVTVAQTNAERIDELMGIYAELGKFNGSILVADQGKVIYKGGYGFANMEWEISNEADTKHRLGSVTKQFTSMLILQLVEEGKLKLDVPISTYLPDYPKEKGDKITLHHLLTHTSGIPNYTAFPGFFQDVSRDPYTIDEFVLFFSEKDLDFEPGERFSYSNSGYFLLGVVLEKTTGNTYEELLHERIFEPLLMTSTGFDHHETILKKRAGAYERNNAGDYVNAAYLDMSIPYAAGSMYSTVEDLFLWDQGLHANSLISVEMKKLMFTEHIPTSGTHYGYGFGISDLKISEDESVRVIGHGGGINGFNTIIKRVPEHKQLVVLLNNTGGTNLNKMYDEIIAILYGQEYELPKKSLANGFLEVIRDEGIKKGKQWFDKTKDDDAYALDETELNKVGYILLREGMIKEAISVFTINTEEFPKSANTYDSLGEAYLADKNKEEALKNYKKVLEIHPFDSRVKKIVKELEGQ